MIYDIEEKIEYKKEGVEITFSANINQDELKNLELNNKFWSNYGVDLKKLNDLPIRRI